ncbi:MAG: FAD-dependent oxidoreductase [Clostridia bacterium]|nr:FAD-dependent oxidoreductase [Clostridia bacterium]
MYDIIIIGSGPAGLTAAIYARRAEKSVLVIEKETFGGEITHSPKVENYPGMREISGADLGERLMSQALDLGAEIEMDTCIDIRTGDNFTVVCEREEYEGRSVIIAGGSKHRRLGLPREEELTGNGISYCSVCDGPFYTGRSVAVIGGGNSALQEAVQLSELCSHVTIVQNLDFLTGEKKLQDILASKDNVSMIFGVTVAELVGDPELTGLVLKHQDGTTETLTVDGAFVAIGQQPENAPFASVATLDQYGYIVADESCETGTPGVYVAGDCRTKAIRQVVTASGDGAIAAIKACKFTEEHR